MAALCDRTRACTRGATPPTLHATRVTTQVRTTSFESKFHLVDLAGSERVKRSGVTGQVRRLLCVGTLDDQSRTRCYLRWSAGPPH